MNYWPYTNIHELNLDWIISKVKELDTRFTDDIETFVREYIDEHFAEWTVNANYNPDDETIIYTNGTGATLTAGDVIRFAIDNAYVNVKDPTARTAASNAATAAAAAQSTANNAGTAAAAAQNSANTANSKADAINAQLNLIRYGTVTTSNPNISNTERNRTYHWMHIVDIDITFTVTSKISDSTAVLFTNLPEAKYGTRIEGYNIATGDVLRVGIEGTTLSNTYTTGGIPEGTYAIQATYIAKEMPT